MFEKRTKKQRTMIYVVIAFFVTLLLALMHIYTWNDNNFIVVAIAAVIEFLCIFYILYLPLKMKKD